MAKSTRSARAKVKVKEPFPNATAVVDMATLLKTAPLAATSRAKEEVRQRLKEGKDTHQRIRATQKEAPKAAGIKDHREHGKEEVTEAKEDIRQRGREQEVREDLYQYPSANATIADRKAI